MITLKRVLSLLLVITMGMLITPDVSQAGDTMWNVPVNVLGEIKADTVDTERLRGMADHIVESGTDLENTINDQLQDGDIVVIAPETVTIDTPLQVTNSRVTIVGAGRGVTTVQIEDGAGTVAFELAIDGNATDIRLQAMTVDGDSEPNNPMIGIGGTQITVQEVNMRNCGRACIGMGIVDNSGTTHTPTEVRIERNRMENSSFALIEVIPNVSGTNLQWAILGNRLHDPFGSHAIFAPDANNHSSVVMNENVIRGPGRNASGGANGIQWDDSPGNGGVQIVSNIFEDIPGVGVQGGAEVAFSRFNGIGDTAIITTTNISLVGVNTTSGVDTAAEIRSAGVVASNNFVASHLGVVVREGAWNNMSVQNNFFFVTGAQPALRIQNDTMVVSSNVLVETGGACPVIDETSGVSDVTYTSNNVVLTSSGSCAYDFSGSRQTFKGNEPFAGRNVFGEVEMDTSITDALRLNENSDTPIVVDGDSTRWLCPSNSNLGCDEGDIVESINPSGATSTKHIIVVDFSAN